MLQIKSNTTIIYKCVNYFYLTNDLENVLSNLIHPVVNENIGLDF